MNYKVLAILIVFIFSSCENIAKKEINLYDLIPVSSEAVISIKNLNKFKSSVANNNYLNSVANSNFVIKNLILQLQKIDNDHML